MENYDTILIFDNNADPNIFEAAPSKTSKRVNNASDPRIIPATKDLNPLHQGFFGVGPDPGAQFSLGPTIKAQLEGMGRNFSVDVFDFGSDVTVCVKYSNPKTGLTASANFLIKYNTKEGTGVVKSSGVRWRTIASHSEAIGYIRARSNALVSKTSSAS